MRIWPTSHPDYAWPQQVLQQHGPVRRFLLACAFHIAHVVGRLLSTGEQSTKRVLVIRTDGVGDALLCEPLIRSLSRSMSRHKVHLWAPRLTCELFSNCPQVDRLMPIPRGFKAGNVEYFGSLLWRIKIGFALGRWTFAKVIYPAQSPEPLGNWLLASTRTSQRWLNSGDTIHQFATQRREAHGRATRILQRDEQNVHELVANESIARQWDDSSQLGSPRVHLSDQRLIRADDQMEAWKIEMHRLGGREIVGVVPAASMSINHYPEERWITVLGRLWNERRAVPVLLGGPDDQSVLTNLATGLTDMHVPHLRLFMRSDILDTAALIARLDGVLSVDTGLAHLAVAQNMPTVVLVGGGNPGRFFPWPNTPHHVALNIATECAGCNNRCNQVEAICITQITPEEIVRAYSRLKTHSVSLQLYVSRHAVYQKAG